MSTAEIAVLQADVGRLKEQVARVEGILIGERDSRGLVGDVVRLQQQVKLLLWLAATIGGASLATLVGIYLKLGSGSPV